MELAARFKHHPPSSQDVIDAHQMIREEMAASAALIEEIVPVGREQSAALTKIEEAMMWANAGIARNQ